MKANKKGFLHPYNYDRTLTIYAISQIITNTDYIGFTVEKGFLAAVLTTALKRCAFSQNIEPVLNIFCF